MIPYTTPTLTITIQANVDLTEADEVFVTITQGGKTVTKTGEDVAVSESGTAVSCWLTQNESMTFKPGTAEAQVNWIYTDVETQTTRRAATDPVSVAIGQQLYKRVIEDD